MYKSLDSRISTFHGKGFPESFPKAYFYFVGDLQHIRTVCCNKVFTRLAPYDDAWKEHALADRFCPVVQLQLGQERILQLYRDQVSCEIDRDEVYQAARHNYDLRRKPERNVNFPAYPVNDVLLMRQQAGSAGRGLFEGIDIVHPHYKGFDSTDNRIDSFPSSFRSSNEQLARCGFFWTGQRVACFQCGRLYETGPEDSKDLGDTHMKDTPTCLHINCVKGRLAVRQACGLVDASETTCISDTRDPYCPSERTTGIRDPPCSPERTTGIREQSGTLDRTDVPGPDRRELGRKRKPVKEFGKPGNPFVPMPTSIADTQHHDPKRKGVAAEVNKRVKKWEDKSEIQVNNDERGLNEDLFMHMACRRDECPNLMTGGEDVMLCCGTGLCRPCSNTNNRGCINGCTPPQQAYP